MIEPDVRRKIVSKFLLQNVNEPVALEIPLNITNRSEIPAITHALSMVGFRGIRFVEDNQVRQYGILTPIMHPDDLLVLYEFLLDLCDDKKSIGGNVTMGFPYVRDIKHLPLLPNNASYVGNIGTEMIKKAKESGESFEFDRSKESFYRDNRTNPKYAQIAQLLGSCGYKYVFSGSKIADPYTVASDYVMRDTRMASGDFDYAISFATRLKAESGHKQESDSGSSFGFFYQYEKMPDQPFFGNTGIEYCSDFSGGMDANETPINRFSNKCVACYLVWEEDGVYKLFKIPENDDWWQAAMKSMPTALHANKSDASFYQWMKDLHESDKKPQSIIDGVEPGHLSEFVAQYKKNKEEKQTAHDNAINDFKEQYKQLSERKNKTKEKIEAFKYLKRKTFFHNGLSYNEIMKNYDEYVGHINGIRAQYADLVREIEQLQQDMHNLETKTEKFPEIETLLSDLSFQQGKLAEGLDAIKTKMDVEERDLRDVDSKVNDDLLSNVARNMSNIHVQNLSNAHKAELIKRVFSKRIMFSKETLKSAVKAYIYLPDSERVKVFDLFHQYSVKVDGKNEMLRNIIKELSPDVPDEIKQLARGRGLLVDHFKRAIKLVEKQYGPKPVENMIQGNELDK